MRHTKSGSCSYWLGAYPFSGVTRGLDHASRIYPTCALKHRNRVNPISDGPSASQERFAKKMDCRVKPGNDRGGSAPTILHPFEREPLLACAITRASARRCAASRIAASCSGADASSPTSSLQARSPACWCARPTPMRAFAGSTPRPPRPCPAWWGCSPAPTWRRTAWRRCGRCGRCARATARRWRNRRASHWRAPRCATAVNLSWR